MIVLCLLRIPLRERGLDAVELARVFVERFSRQYALPNKRISPGGENFIRKYSWPGNVRELENLVHREFLMITENQLHFAEAGARMDWIGHESSDSNLSELGFREAKLKAIAEFEKRYLREVLARAGGNLSAAARIADTDRSAFGKLARKHGSRGIPSLSEMGG
jgi:transcriptional regulator with GAF, ATPase, and Fis domain